MQSQGGGAMTPLFRFQEEKKRYKQLRLLIFLANFVLVRSSTKRSSQVRSTWLPDRRSGKLGTLGTLHL